MIAALTAASSGGEGEGTASLPPGQSRLREIGAFIDRFVSSLDWIGERIAAARGETRRALEGALDAELSRGEAPDWQVEAQAAVGELEWRIREFARELRLRDALVADDADGDLGALLARLEAAA